MNSFYSVFPADICIHNVLFAGDLLHNTVQMVEKLLDVDEELCASWGKAQLINALLEAAKQVS